MKLSIWSHYFNGLSPEEKVQAFAECGYQYLELSTEDGEELLRRGDPENVGSEFKKVADDYGICFLQGHLDLGADIRNSATVESLKIWLDLFKAIDIKACVLHYSRGRDLNVPPDRLLLSRAHSFQKLTCVTSKSQPFSDLHC